MIAQSTVDFSVICWPLNMVQPRPGGSQEDFLDHGRQSSENFHTLLAFSPSHTQLHVFPSSLPLQSMKTLQDLLTDVYTLKVSVETLRKDVDILKKIFDKVDPPQHPPSWPCFSGLWWLG